MGKLLNGLLIASAAALIVPLYVDSNDEDNTIEVQSLLCKVKFGKNAENREISISLPGLLSKESREKVSEMVKSAIRKNTRVDIPTAEDECCDCCDCDDCCEE